jgi:hypothetical protein
MNEVLVLEFNELNREVLETLVQQGQLPNFASLLSSHTLSNTTVGEDYEKLEPWIQWVTAHTGKSQVQHGAFNLSDVQHSNLVQIWDVLEAQGIACGLMSPMNARRGNVTKGFFIPDPWTTSNDAHPPSAARIFKFLAEKVQSHNVSLDGGSSKLTFVLDCIKLGVPFTALARLGMGYIKSRIDKRNKWKLAAELDLFLFELTLTLKHAFKTQYTTVFMNSVAHYQHHYWTCHQPETWSQRFPKLFKLRNPVAEANLHPGDDPMLYGLQLMDDMVGRAIKVVGKDSVMVLTGLSQIPFEGYAGAKGFYLYRPIDHAKLFAALHIVTERIAPLMSRDVMLYFPNAEARTVALEILRSARVNGIDLFLCTEEDDHRLFCKVDYSFDMDSSTVVHANSLPAAGLNFQELFMLITFKTGHHSPMGMIIAPKNVLTAESIALQTVPELIFKLMGVKEPEQAAHALSLSPV